MPSIIVHGGAGRLQQDREGELGRRAGLERAATAGAERMRRGDSALDAVCAAVETLEDDPPFNAGTGAVLTVDGEVETDAAVTTGDGRCGACGARCPGVFEGAPGTWGSRRLPVRLGEHAR